MLVQALVRRPHGREVLCGIARDASFGPVLTFGLGGVTVEVMRDAAVALPPLNRVLARDLIARTRAARLLDAFRGSPPADLDAVVEVLLRLSDLACELPCVRELDINPLLADEHGVTVLDARIFVDDGALAPDARFGHLAIHPYPRSLERPLRLRDGSELLLRPIRPEDGEAQRRFIARLSQQSMYLRFHAPLRELSLQRIVRFTQIDYDHEMAIVAVPRDAGSSDDEPALMHGVASYTRNPDGHSAEFGLVVEDSWQGRGLGSALMDALETCARSRGIAALIGYVLRDNHDMCRLMRARGYRGETDAHEVDVVRYVLIWPAADEPTR
ncbi:MAG TPA: GNAT family N-acetyltransferase [Burkholderiaceae bacterium]|nr:GNAT family N-acetyltransferase [Burkholderiaceae bacterium]